MAHSGGGLVAHRRLLIPPPARVAGAGKASDTDSLMTVDA
jgi:hypothetical protein